LINKVLIANRGEIAVRIIRAAAELGIKTVAVYSEADKDALHTIMADEAVCIGGAKSSESYLNINNILSAAIATGVDAIHPGFGFLSENPKFATMCEEIGIEFIGPSAKVMELMGNKVNARESMMNAGVPVIPGSKGIVKTYSEAKKIAKKIGYPVMLKAASGGGGKGIRKVSDEKEMESLFETASKEALVSFGDSSMYIEKLVYPARHIEVQILADKFGNVIHLGERDCSLQRNNQKVLEESPSVSISEILRKKIGDIARKAAAYVGYEGAGTLEFLYQNRKFYFMEMNTRIQVEHPVSEYVTGVDIVKEQFRIASGEKLRYKQKDIIIRGHAIECRINAENPKLNFMPSSGKINGLFLPSGGPGIRVDSAMYQGYSIPPYYDSMIAKVIVHGEDRMDAIMKMQRALMEFEIDGVVTNVDFLLDLIGDKQVLSGKYSTAYLAKKFLPRWIKAAKREDEIEEKAKVEEEK
jgi:acetyl-CoA carboxylase biotin carboxylase subunit